MGERRKTLPFLSVCRVRGILEGEKSVVCCLRQHHLFLHGCGKVLPRGRATASPNISGMLFYEKRRFFVEGMRKQPAPEGDECPLFPCPTGACGPGTEHTSADAIGRLVRLCLSGSAGAEGRAASASGTAAGQDAGWYADLYRGAAGHAVRRDMSGRVVCRAAMSSGKARTTFPQTGAAAALFLPDRQTKRPAEAGLFVCS